MNGMSAEVFANRVIDRLVEFDDVQKQQVKTAILDTSNSFAIYSSEEAAEIIKEPLLVLEQFARVKKYEGLSEATIGMYRSNVTHFIASTVKKIEEITADDIRSYLNNKIISGIRLTSANTIRSSLSSFFSWMLDEEYINRNPMNKVKKIKCERVLKPAFNEIEVDALRRAASDDVRNMALIDFFLSTGCRVSEVRNADISNVDFSGKKLRVVGKGNKSRIVYLTDVAICTLKAYIRSRNDTNESLFVSKRYPHERMTTRGIEVALSEIGKRAHVNDVHPHRFRHTCCTRLLCRGMELQNVSRILGHADVNTTMLYNNTPDDYVDSKFRQYSF